MKTEFHLMCSNKVFFLMLVTFEEKDTKIRNLRPLSYITSQLLIKVMSRYKLQFLTFCDLLFF